MTTASCRVDIEPAARHLAARWRQSSEDPAGRRRVKVLLDKAKDRLGDDLVGAVDEELDREDVLLPLGRVLDTLGIDVANDLGSVAHEPCSSVDDDWFEWVLGGDHA